MVAACALMQVQWLLLRMAIVPKLYHYICMNAHFAFAHTHYIYKENASLG
ncbi:hypothetical protein HMPREF0670_02154 [Prevotella sp. oral taxon 317 str. F0108]|nr:hypothetical protein HMPREF0670_02154 [Prevotella sp. oral taxon 317 str. F0108]